MKHTPYRAVTKGFENPTQVINSKRETIAVIYSDAEGGDQYDNARLFAAAPDLLAALEMIREAASGHVPLVNSWVLSVTRAAINKTGA